MPPTDRFVISFAAEPPQEPLPYGRWGDTLAGHFRGASARSTPRARRSARSRPRSRGSPTGPTAGARTSPRWRGRTSGYELFGFVSFTEGAQGPSDFEARADFTAELAESNPDWKLDLNDEVIGPWRGEQGNTADITLVWGVPLVPGGAVVTAELADLAVDQSELVEDRFTLIAPDNYRSDYPRDQALEQGAATSLPASRSTSRTTRRKRKTDRPARRGGDRSSTRWQRGRPGAAS